MKSALLLLLLLCLTATANGAVYTGSVGPGYHFVAKFVFDTYDFAIAQRASTGQGSTRDAATWSLTRTGAGVGHAVSVFYDDTDFADLLSQDLSCAAMLNVSDQKVMDLTRGQSYEDRVVWQASRPRFWFTSIANCDPSLYDASLGPFEYRLEMLNPGGFLRRHFSVDVQGVAEAYMAAVAVYVVLGVAACCMLCKGRRGKRPASPTPSLVFTTWRLVWG